MAVEFLEKQAANRHSLVKSGFNFFWALVVLSIPVQGMLLYIHLDAQQAVNAQLISTNPIQPGLLVCSLLLTIGAVIVGLHLRQIVINTDDSERYVIRKKLDESSIAEDIENDRVDYTRILSQVSGSSCLWRLGFQCKAGSRTEKHISILASNLSAYLGYKPASYLSNNSLGLIWAISILLISGVIVILWHLANAPGLDCVEAIQSWATIISITLIQGPCLQLEAVCCQELSRHLRIKLDFTKPV